MRVIEKRSDAMRKAFSKIDKVANYTKNDIDKIVESGKVMKGKRGRSKIEAYWKNAKRMQEIVRQYGSFERYLDSFVDSNDIEGLVNNLVKKRRFGFIGKVTVNGFLKDIGLGKMEGFQRHTMKTDVHVLRILNRLGLIESLSPTNENIDSAIKIGKAIAEAVNERLDIVDEVIWIYGSSGIGYVKEAICGDKPGCNECYITKLCEYPKKQK
jgi:hypothetical protein